jgi:hypothetical protein
VAARREKKTGLTLRRNDATLKKETIKEFFNLVT